jgi:hypothetical protein
MEANEVAFLKVLHDYVEGLICTESANFLGLFNMTQSGLMPTSGLASSRKDILAILLLGVLKSSICFLEPMPASQEVRCLSGSLEALQTVGVGLDDPKFTITLSSLDESTQRRQRANLFGPP